MAVATVTLAQTATNTNMVATKDFVLGTKTPLGEALITIPAGSTLTNVEVAGESVTIKQGPFSATVALAELQPASSAPSPSPAPDLPQTAPVEQIPTPSPTATPQERTTSGEDVAPSAKSKPENNLPEWAVPAAGGALAAYAIFATLALFRSRRAPSGSSAKSEPAKTPVVTLPSKAAAKPAMMADGGHAIACPLCGKNIPMETVGEGHNRCPSCHEAFFVE